VVLRGFEKSRNPRWWSQANHDATPTSFDVICLCWEPKKIFLCSTAKQKDYVSGKMWTVTLVTHITTEGVTIESAKIEA